MYPITQMPELIGTPEFQMRQKSGSEHKPVTILCKAGSAGPEDLAIFNPGTAAGARAYEDNCASISSSPIADTALRLGWPWKQ